MTGVLLRSVLVLRALVSTQGRGGLFGSPITLYVKYLVYNLALNSTAIYASVEKNVGYFWHFSANTTVFRFFSA